MTAFLVLMLALGGLIGAVSYWISWEMQDKRQRIGFTKTLCNDAARLFARKTGGSPASGTPLRAADNGPAHGPNGVSAELESIIGRDKGTAEALTRPSHNRSAGA